MSEEPRSVEAAGEPLVRVPVWRRVHVRVSLLYGVVFFVVLLLLSMVFYQRGAEQALEGLQARLLARTVSLAAALSHQPVTVGDPELVSLLERSVDGDPEIVSIYIMLRDPEPGFLIIAAEHSPGGSDPAGTRYDARALPVLLMGLEQPAVESRLYADTSGLTLSGYAPIRSAAGTNVGLVGVDVSAARVAAIQDEVLRFALVAFGGGLALLGLLTVVLGRALRGPLAAVVRAAGEVAAGRFAARVRSERLDELGVLSRHFDEMAAGLEDREKIRALFGRFVSRDVARKLLEQRGEIPPEQRDVTVLFSDLVSYSTVSETLPPQQIVALLNEYLEAMHGCVEAEHGCVLEYTGDGILAVFGAPATLPGHAGAAMRAALGMQSRLRALNDEWERSGRAEAWKSRGVETLRARIGLHTGLVVAGTVGARDRMKYGVIGDTVNVAARLETLNKELGTSILVSGSCLRELPAELRALLVPRGEHRVKGRVQEVDVYSVA